MFCHNNSFKQNRFFHIMGEEYATNITKGEVTCKDEGCQVREILEECTGGAPFHKKLTAYCDERCIPQKSKNNGSPTSVKEYQLENHCQEYCKTPILLRELGDTDSARTQRLENICATDCEALKVFENIKKDGRKIG